MKIGPMFEMKMLEATNYQFPKYLVYQELSVKSFPSLRCDDLITCSVHIDFPTKTAICYIVSILIYMWRIKILASTDSYSSRQTFFVSIRGYAFKDTHHMKYLDVKM